MFPTRRTVLRSTGLVAIGLAAGCLGADGPGGDGTDTTDDGLDTTDQTDTSSDTSPAGSGGPHVTITAVDAAPDIPLEPAVEVTERSATDDHPPQVRVTLTNASDENVEAGEGRAIFFEYVYDDARELVFLPPGSDYPAEPDCWRLTEPIAVTEEYRIVTFEPGESTSALVDLYGAPTDEDSCLPVGEYRFETTISVGGLSDADERTDATWGFSVVLE